MLFSTTATSFINSLPRRARNTVFNTLIECFEGDKVSKVFH